MHRIWLFMGAVAGLTAVGLSAWAAHGAPSTFAPAPRRAVDNALMIQGWHAFALIAAGLLAERDRVFANLAGLAFAVGTVLFCGAVWWGVLGLRPLGLPIAPLGGVTLMIGWALLALAALRR